MAVLILHHYPMSPFSEKIRVMLGYAGLDWQSCRTREMPPRPLLERLAGGYRKIPVAQIGADIFCDSHLIAAEIARLSGKPDLAPENLDAGQQAFISRADNDLFFPCLFAAGTLKLNLKVLKAMSLPDIGRFLIDRVNMGRTARVKAPSPLKAKGIVMAHLADLEQQLTADFLFGDAPTHADFSAYHSLWFIHDLAESPLLQGHTRLLDWMARMKAFGHGRFTEIREADALAAAGAEPLAITPEHRQDPLIGQSVRIAPADYGCTPTTGILAGATDSRWILARRDPEAGLLHVHFPKAGYTLDAL